MNHGTSHTVKQNFNKGETWIMKGQCCLENEKPIIQYMKNETKCLICENTVFRICRITPELVMLTCEKCGESHMIGINSDESGSSLTFWSQETGIED